MPDQMYLTITLRKPVPDAPAGKVIYDIVKQRMADRPDVVISGHVTNHFDMEDPIP